MRKPSVIFIETDGGSVEVNITHIEARRLIGQYELSGPNDEPSNIGSWTPEGRERIFIHLRT